MNVFEVFCWHGDWHCLHSLHSSFLEKGLEADETGGFQMDDLSGWLSGALVPLGARKDARGGPYHRHRTWAWAL